MARTTRPPPATAAYVLHQHDWSESSLIVDLFTREHGRIAVAAKGAKRPYSQLRGLLLPFQRLNISLGRPSADAGVEIQPMRAVEWAGGLPAPSGAALFSGWYLNELLLRLLARQDPHPALFDAYAEALPWLGGVEAEVQATLRGFELALLRHTGVLPDLRMLTATAQPLQDPARYTLHAEAGVVRVAADEPGLSAAALLAAQQALDRGAAAELRAACLGELAAWRSALRPLLHYHLGSDVLRTRRLMLEVQRLIGPSPMPPR